MAKCPECSSVISDELVLCPNCGALMDKVSKTQPVRKIQFRGLKISPLALAVAIFACLMLGLVAASGVAGYYQGLSDREKQVQDTAGLHFTRGQQHLRNKQFDQAKDEFEYVLQIAPDYPSAAEMLAETRRRMATVPTTTPGAKTNIIVEVYNQGQAAFQAQDWEKASLTLAQVRAIDPAYEKASVEDMLFTARLQNGLKLLNNGQLEEGIFYLDQAAELRPLDQDKAAQRQFAAMYVTASGYFGVDWQKAIERFAELYRMAPNYRDTGRKLVEAYAGYGDVYAKRQDYCPAAQIYSDGLKAINDASLQAKQNDAQQRCQSATPTPITGTVMISGTPVPLTGLPTGRLAYPLFNGSSGKWEVHLLNASTQRSDKVISGGDQPAIQPNGPMIAYRSPGVGINLYNYAENSDKTLVRDPTAAWPTWSPDGKRLAYSLKDSSESYRTFIVSLDAPEQPRVIAAGWGPSWSSRGALAYTGCGAGGVCGIFVVHPDQTGTPPVKLTADRNDTALAWSPDGNNIAYMSNHGGNWEIYMVTTAGSVRQLTGQGVPSGLPAWAPDSSGLAFISNRGGSWSLFLMRPDGSDQRKLVDLGSRAPSWQDQRLSWAP